MSLVKTLTGHTSDVASVDFSGSKLIASASNDKTVRLWQFDEPTQQWKESSLSPLPGHKYGVNCVRFSPFGTIIASCSTDGNVILWNAQSGEQVVKLKHTGGGAIRVCSFSPSSALLATGGDDERISIWDISTRAMIKSLSEHEAMITALSFTPDSNYLISGSTGGDLKLWDTRVDSDRCLVTVEMAHDLGVLGCDFSSRYQVNVSDGPVKSFYLLASCGNDDLVKIWHVKGGSIHCQVTLSHSLQGHAGNVNCCRFSLDGSLLASAAGDKLVIIWDPMAGVALHKLEGHNRFVTSCAFSADMRHVVTGSNDKTLMVWSIDQGDSVKGTYACLGGETPIRAAASQAASSPVAEWTIEDVKKWLDRLGLAQYSAVFEENAIDGKELLHLTQDTLLTQLKIDALGHRNKILRGVQALKNPFWQHLIQNDDDNPAIPEELHCPITHDLMTDPVVAQDGYTYEKEAITKWFEAGNKTSPMTNEPLESEDLVPNRTLRLLIQKYIQH